MRKRNKYVREISKEEGWPRVLGLMVIYEAERSTTAIDRFKDFLANNYRYFEVRIITNNRELSADLVGSNACGEFSAWAEGLERENIEEFDIYIFANDTFQKNERFDYLAENNFVKEIAKSYEKYNKFLIGEVGWHIDYQLACQGKFFLTKWVRTSIFAMSSDTLKSIGYVALPKLEIDLLVGENISSGFDLSSSLPLIIRRRIEEWLLPGNVAHGWHSARIVTKQKLRLKAKCILQEILLTQRCIQTGAKICTTRSKGYTRELILNLVFYLQTKFFRNPE